MAGLPPVPGTVKVRLKFTIGIDVNCASSLFFSYSGSGVTKAGLDALAAEVSVAWGAHMTGGSTPDRVLTGVETLDLSDPTALPGEWSGTVPGTSSSASTRSPAASISASCVNVPSGPK